MSIKNPVKTSNLNDVGHIADKAISTSQSVTSTSEETGEAVHSIPSSNGTFEEQVENEINKRLPKERK